MTIGVSINRYVLAYFHIDLNWLMSYLYKKMTINCSEIIAPYPCCRPYPRCLKKIVLGQLYDYKRFVIRKPIRFQKTTLYRVSRFMIDGPNPPWNGSKQNTIFFTLTLIERIRNFKPSHIIVKTRISWGKKHRFVYQRTWNGGATGISFGTFVVSYICERYTYCE